jgi:hypothetical protein
MSSLSAKCPIPVPVGAGSGLANGPSNLSLDRARADGNAHARNNGMMRGTTPKRLANSKSSPRSLAHDAKCSKRMKRVMAMATVSSRDEMNMIGG